MRPEHGFLGLLFVFPSATIHTARHLTVPEPVIHRFLLAYREIVPDVHATLPPASAAPVAAADAADDGTRVPGCGKSRDHDGEPAVPSRARAGHDLAAGLAPWGLPEAGAPSAAPPAQIRARAPAPYTPTPVELSVLRV
ncbi:hypothetical protein [Streptomyces sp. AS13]|uniref:hypothetical protein n=1 Tax=Streptomyces sp. AS13 TaxID=3038080 RepID=UPI00278C5EAC|nr:hypothetical protein [Streptomyces sp. AS13]